MDDHAAGLSTTVPLGPSQTASLPHTPSRSSPSLDHSAGGAGELAAGGLGSSLRSLPLARSAPQLWASGPLGVPGPVATPPRMRTYSSLSAGDSPVRARESGTGLDSSFWVQARSSPGASPLKASAARSLRDSLSQAILEEVQRGSEGPECASCPDLFRGRRSWHQLACPGNATLHRKLVCAAARGYTPPASPLHAAGRPAALRAEAQGSLGSASMGSWRRSHSSAAAGEDSRPANGAAEQGCVSVGSQSVAYTLAGHKAPAHWARTLKRPQNLRGKPA
mmetsp:Transcript_74181/g.239921  ORF Transcript_74181/g.239921 Transcript_74181/m.239921 type:complete len:279 (+) Transcript_74181:66-902(+)